MIYFDKNKQAYAYEIENPLFTCDESIWQPYSTKTLGKDYDITEKGFVDIIPTVEERNEVIRQTRESLYIQTSDKLKADYDEAVARGSENAEQLKQEWLASKDKIREENPYIS